MHPVLARYLDIAEALDTLGRVREDGVGADAMQAAYLDAAEGAPELVDALRAVQGQKRLTEEAQHALLSLAAQATLRVLSQDPDVLPKLAAANGALESAGATGEQAEAYLSALVLEEAFGGDD